VQGEQVDGRPATVLVVDDDALNRRLLVRALSADGHRAIEAVNGRDALDVLTRERPDVMLLDVMMPELDGFGVLTEMKTIPSVAATPVVMISSLEGQEGILRCIELGADDFLPKPADAAILRARVNAGLNKKRLHDMQRQHMHDTFARFLPESIVEQVLADNDNEPRIGARQVTGTVVFSDLRGFTTFAETHSADVVIDVLNQYLGEMSDAVLDHGGTLVAYLGDGVMSVFGAPVEADDHADRALAAALEMVGERMENLNSFIRDRGVEHEFRIGVGVNSGSLMSGNVGSARRLEYAAIGDTTNTAARVEDLTKEHGVPLLLTQQVLDHLVDPVDGVEFVAEVAPRGRIRSVRLYTIARGQTTDA
jgi:adenylate cyclase